MMRSKNEHEEMYHTKTDWNTAPEMNSCMFAESSWRVGQLYSVSLVTASTSIKIKDQVLLRHFDWAGMLNISHDSAVFTVKFRPRQDEVVPYFCLL